MSSRAWTSEPANFQGGSLGSSQYEYKSEKEKGLGFLTPINSLVSAVYSMHGRFLYG